MGSDELSPHNLTVGSTLFNTQSKCMSLPIVQRVVLDCKIVLHTFYASRATPDEISPLPIQLPVVKPDPDRANPKIGVSVLAFSSDSRYLATKNGKSSELFIFTFTSKQTELSQFPLCVSALHCLQTTWPVWCGCGTCRR